MTEVKPQNRYYALRIVESEHVNFPKGLYIIPAGVFRNSFRASGTVLPEELFSTKLRAEQVRSTMFAMDIHTEIRVLELRDITLEQVGG